MELESWAGRDVTSTVLADGLLGSHTLDKYMECWIALLSTRGG